MEEIILKGLRMINEIDRTIEMWKQIESSKYSISSFGRVRNDETGRILKTHLDKGYEKLKVKLTNKAVALKIHRVVAEAFLTNPLNKSCVDHIDNDTTNNHFSNLRYATRCENNFNTKKYKNNTSGVKGVSFHKRFKKWNASIGINGSLKHIGYFNSIEDAKQAIEETRIEIHGEFANHG